MYIQNNLLYMIGIKIDLVKNLICKRRVHPDKQSCLPLVPHHHCTACVQSTWDWIPGIATGCAGGVVRNSGSWCILQRKLSRVSTPVCPLCGERECVRESVCVREKGRESERDNHYNHFISIIVLYNLFIPISKPVFLTHWYKQLCYSMYGCGDMHHFI